MVPTDTAGSLRSFIQANHREILDAFSGFAKTLMPPSSAMTTRELEDHCEELLLAVAEDLERSQTAEEQSEKAHGRGTAHMMRASGQRHADGRLEHGFGLVEVFGEFRALRASVLQAVRALSAIGHRRDPAIQRGGGRGVGGIRHPVQRATRHLPGPIHRHSQPRPSRPAECDNRRRRGALAG